MAGTNAKQKIEMDEAGEITATLDGAVFKITRDSKVTAFTEANVEPKAALGAATEGVVSIGKDFAVSAYGAKIVPTATGYTVYADSITLRHANENKTSTAIEAALKAHAVGDHLKDGTFCIWVDIKQNLAKFVPEDIFGGESNFDSQDNVVKKANKSGIHGHKDWRRITDDEGKTLSDNWAAVAPKDLQGSSAPWFWLASPGSNGGLVRRGGGEADPCYSNRHDSRPVPVVRSGPARS
jgi:hypothetical protein